MATVTADSITPSSGSGLGPQTFVLVYTNSGGAVGLDKVWLVFQEPFEPVKPQIILHYRVDSGEIALYKADESGYWTGPAGSAGTLTNGIVTVDLAACSAALVGTTITLTISLTFSAAAWGKRTAYLFASNGPDNSGYQNRGTWTVPGAPSEAIRLVDGLTVVRTPLEALAGPEAVRVRDWVTLAVHTASLAEAAKVGDAVSAQLLQGSTLRVWVGGVQIVGPESSGVEQMICDAFQVTDVVGGAANSATVRVRRLTPVEGSAIVIALDSQEVFAGTVIRTTQVIAEHTLAVLGWDLECLSDQYLLDAKVVNARYVVESASAIVPALVSAFAPGFTVTVDPDLVTLDEMTITNERVSDSLDRIAARAGVSWRLGTNRDITFGDILLPDARPITDADTASVQGTPAIRRDYSQIKTRIFSEGGGVNLLTLVEAGDMILPVAATDWYDVTGGLLAVGPDRVTYTGLDVGGSGGLVGPGASPSAAPVADVTPGANLGSGLYQYAITFVTAAGETLPSPIASVTTGYTAAPTSAPSFAANTAGTGPDLGVHWYAVTFVTSSGETSNGPDSNNVTTTESSAGALTDPVVAPTAGSPTAGGSVPIGTHHYKYTFANGAGETVPSSAGTGTADALITPGGGCIAAAQAGGSIAPEQYVWGVTYGSPAGETAITLSSNALVLSGGNGSAALTGVVTSSDARCTFRRVYRRLFASATWGLVGTISNNTQTTYTDTSASVGAEPPTSSTALYQTIPLTIPVGPTGTTSRKVYRNDGGTYKLAGSVSGNTSTSFVDSLATGSLGAAAPSSNTTASVTAYRTVNLTNIPIGPSGTTARKLYRTAAGGSQLKLVATIGNNTATTYQDTTTDASLGANIPTSNTATANRVALSAIPLGPTGTTARRVYRTTVGGSALQRLTTLADNTTTTYADSTADGSLGAAVPGIDTSGLESAAGSVNPGATTVPCASMGTIPTSGWAIIGNGQQVIRYTGKTDTALTGVPASGPGSIVAAIGYNSTITGAPQLTGIPASGDGSLTQDALAQTPVNVLTQHDDGAAQAMMAARTGGDGIFEEWIRDQRFSLAETRNRGAAKLAERVVPLVSVSYLTRDPASLAGAYVSWTRSAPVGISETLRIQSARLSLQMLADGSVRPEWEVEASTRRYSFEQWLRRVAPTTGDTAS